MGNLFGTVILIQLLNRRNYLFSAANLLLALSENTVLGASLIRVS